MDSASRQDASKAPLRTSDLTGRRTRRILDRKGRSRSPRLTVGLSYYAPYMSGLSEAAKRLNESLVARGWDVNVVTTRYDDTLARHSVIDGVGVRRCRRLLSVGRAAFSPSFPVSLAREMRQADLTLMHLPLPEAGPMALMAPKHRLVTFYHCDPASLRVPGEGLVRRLLDRSHRRAIRRSVATIATTADYAQNSRLAEDLMERHVTLPPPCVERPLGEPTYRESGGLHVGFLGRIVPEKGLEYLVSAFRRNPDPDARLLLAGDFDEIAGGSAIRAVNEAAEGDPRIRLLGFIPDSRIPDFYASIDVFALPSVDSFEAFGIVQVEALMAGVPIVSSDLPGVRTVGPSLGAGIVVPRRDVGALADALAVAAKTDVDRNALRTAAIEAYGVESVADRLDEFLWRLLLANGAKTAPAEMPPKRVSVPARAGRNASFDDDPERYEELRQGWLFERRVKEILGYLAMARPGDVVLEVGCGTGGLLRRLSAERPDLRFRGVEPLESYVEFCGRQSTVDADRLTVVQGFAENLGTLELPKADWILTNDVLHHVDDFLLATQGLAAVSQPWAQWLSIEPNPQNPWVIWYHTRTEGERVFHARTFLKAARESGWELLNSDRLFLVPQAIRQPPKVLQLAERGAERMPVISGGLLLHLSRVPDDREPSDGREGASGRGAA